MPEDEERPTIGWQSAEVALEPWFESEEKFRFLPKDLRLLFSRGRRPTQGSDSRTRAQARAERAEDRFGINAALWNNCSPAQRREMARQRDIKSHPDPELADLNEVMWAAMMELERWERVGSNKLEADREARDVKVQAEEIARARNEVSEAQTALQRKAQSLGLNSPYDEAPSTTTLGPARSSPSNSLPQLAVGEPINRLATLAPATPRGLQTADAPLLERMHSLLTEKKARSIWNAAQIVAPDAQGSKQGESTCKRLTDKYKIRFEANKLQL